MGNIYNVAIIHATDDRKNTLSVCLPDEVEYHISVISRNWAHHRVNFPKLIFTLPPSQYLIICKEENHSKCSVWSDCRECEKALQKIEML